MTEYRLSLRRNLRRGFGERGAAFIEFALIVPVMTLLAMGLVEYGLAWGTTNDVNAAVRDAARTGSSGSTYEQADRSIVRQLAMTLGKKEIDGIQRVVVFKAATADGEVPSECLTAPIDNGSIPLGENGVCNVYNWGQIEAVRRVLDQNAGDDGDLAPTFGDASGCPSGSWDSRWCPTTRVRNMRTNTFDYIGVYLELKKPSVTNFGFGDQTIRRSAVFRLEPSLGTD